MKKTAAARITMMTISAKYGICCILPTVLSMFLRIILIFMIMDISTSVKRHFLLTSHHAACYCLPKMSTNTSSVIYIRTCAFPEPIPYFLRHIGISSDPATPSHSHFQQGTLGIISNSFNIRTAKTKCHCNLILPINYVLCTPGFHFASFLLYEQPLN